MEHEIALAQVEALERAVSALRHEVENNTDILLSHNDVKGAHSMIWKAVHLIQFPEAPKGERE